MNSYFFRYFVLPFSLGAIFLFAVLAVKYIKWFVAMSAADRKLFLRSLPTRATLVSIAEIVRESLLHLKIWRVNPVLGYMHTTFALGWFTLIVVGWVEAMVVFKGESVPLYVDIFFSYYEHAVFEHAFNFAFIKDFLLLLILLGVALAMFKRVRSSVLGMRKTTKHVLGDRVALTALWLIFVARLLAESTTSGAVMLENGVGSGSFLTNTVGRGLHALLAPSTLVSLELPMWWFYSITLGVFFVSLPFSRYMHIFTEIPLIFLRNAGIKSTDKPSGFDNFQIEACSRCGICLDPCQLQRDADINNVQSAYFLRDLRYGGLTQEVASNCLMCGRCENVCPVGIDLNTIRQSSRRRFALADTDVASRYNYLGAVDCSRGAGRVGYFAGCMTLLTPRVLKAMNSIFEAAGEDVWRADQEGGVCCGRPLKLAGDIDSARKIMDYNVELFKKHKIETLVTSCPICYKVFNEDYNLEGVRVLHHSEYIAELIAQARISLEAGDKTFTYHDPCELGRGSGIYDAPREVIAAVGSLAEAEHNREDALCCGASLANSQLSYPQVKKIASAMTAELEATRAEAIVTSCPLCKKTIAAESSTEVYDLSEIVAARLK